MEMNDDERRELEEALEALQGLDAADLPEPASRLADLLERLLHGDGE